MKDYFRKSKADPLLAATVIPGWTEELASLDAETTRLLADVRGERKRPKDTSKEAKSEPFFLSFGKPLLIRYSLCHINSHSKIEVMNNNNGS